jgi:hypothetical protein
MENRGSINIHTLAILPDSLGRLEMFRKQFLATVWFLGFIVSILLFGKMRFVGLLRENPK